MPALHISLGTYLKIFNMLEDDCHTLDCKIAVEQPETENSNFGQYAERRKEIEKLEKSVNDLQHTLDLINNAISTAIMGSPENEAKIKDVYEARFEHFIKKRNEKVCSQKS